MGDDHHNFSHHRYAQRLAEIEKRELERKRQHQVHRHQSSESIGNKLPKLKKQRHGRTALRAILLLLFFATIFAGMLFIISPFSKVDKIAVVGNHQLTDREVIKATGLSTNDFMWKIDQRSKVINKTARKENPEIKNVAISVTGFRDIKLTVVENQLIGSVYRNGVYLPVLSSGHVINHAQGSPVHGGAVYSGFKSQKILVQTAQQYAGLSQVIQDGISEVKFQPTKNDPQRLRLFMNDGNEVLIKYTQLKEKMAYYPGIASSMSSSGIVNLEVGAYSRSY